MGGEYSGTWVGFTVAHGWGLQWAHGWGVQWHMGGVYSGTSAGHMGRGLRWHMCWTWS